MADIAQVLILRLFSEVMVGMTLHQIITIMAQCAFSKTFMQYPDPSLELSKYVT